MSLAKAVHNARNWLTGSGPDQKPSLVFCDDRRTLQSPGSDTVTLGFLDDISAAVEPGYILSAYNPDDVNDAAVFHVVGESGNDFWCFDGYGGSPAGVDVENSWLEVNPPDGWTSHALFRRAEFVTDNHLWPEVWQWMTFEVANPNYVRGWVELTGDNSKIEKIDAAYQFGAVNDLIEIPAGLHRQSNIGAADLGTILQYELAWPGRKILVRGRRRFEVDDLTGSSREAKALVEIVGAGTAALTLDAGVTTTKFETPTGEQVHITAPYLWRSFVNQRRAFARSMQTDRRNVIKYAGGFR